MVTELQDPEKLETPYFKIQSTLEPHNLVKTSEIILQAVNDQPLLTYSYCLEVVFEDDKALFTLCLNPVLWFDLYLSKKDLDVAARIARTYVTNTRLTVPYENDKMAPFEVELLTIRHLNYANMEKSVERVNAVSFSLQTHRFEISVFLRDIN